MKIDKRNPKHWLLLFVFAANVLLGVVARWTFSSHPRLVILYGHKLNGNLKALYRELRRRSGSKLDPRFLTMDPAYARALRAEGVRTLSAVNPAQVAEACRGACVVTDHGLHALVVLHTLTATKFVDVWHGIPFKGFDADDFRALHRHDAVLVSSPSIKAIYEDRFGFARDRVFATGYGRTDALVRRGFDESAIRRGLAIDDNDRKIVLMAPTWRHDRDGRSEIPFGMTPHRFFGDLDRLAAEHGFIILFRAHLNSALSGSAELPNVRSMPLARYPDTEELLFVSDVLVSDWSSIVFDFLVLRRPTVFLDVAAPFAKGFTLGPEYRFGPVVRTFEELCETLVRCCRQSDQVIDEHAETMTRVSEELYGGTLDGRSCERYVERIESLITASA